MNMGETIIMEETILDFYPPGIEHLSSSSCGYIDKNLFEALLEVKNYACNDLNTTAAAEG